MLLLVRYKRLGRTLVDLEIRGGLIALVLFNIEGELIDLALLETQVTFARCSGGVSVRCCALLNLETWGGSSVVFGLVVYQTRLACTQVRLRTRGSPDEFPAFMSARRLRNAIAPGA